jgi:hypothetical protein
MTNVADSLVLLYRNGTMADWTIIPTTRTGNNSLGFVFTDSLKPGEYALGIRNWQLYQSTGTLFMNSNNEIRIIPNPASQICTIKYDFKSGDVLHVIDIQGKNIYSEKSFNSEKEIKLAISTFHPGLYFVTITPQQGKSITGRMIIE